MTRLVGNKLIIESTEPATCELCGEVRELRPYGPNAENVCYSCGMKDEKAARKWFYLFAQGKHPCQVKQ